MNSEQVSVQTATVQVQVLTIGERQVTAGVIRQVPAEWNDPHNDPAPWVQYACGVDGACELKGSVHVHFLWVTSDGALRRDVARPGAPLPVILRRDLGVTGTPSSADRTEAESIREQDDQCWGRAADLPHVYAAGMR